MQISPKLELCRANQDQIRNQRHRLRRNRLLVGRTAGGGVPDQCHKGFANLRKYSYTRLRFRGRGGRKQSIGNWSTRRARVFASTNNWSEDWQRWNGSLQLSKRVSFESIFESPTASCDYQRVCSQAGDRSDCTSTVATLSSSFDCSRRIREQRAHTHGTWRNSR